MPADTIDRDRIAQETAEYIAYVLMPRHDEIVSKPGIEVTYVEGKRPPRSIDEIKATLLSGHVWISWMDDRVNTAMRQLHGVPTGDATFILPQPEPEPMIHVDEYGDPHKVTVKVHKTTGERTVHYDLDAYTPAQARALAADLIAGAELAELPIAVLAEPRDDED